MSCRINSLGWLFLLACETSMVGAADVPYGADALPYLASRAVNVVKGSSPKEAEAADPKAKAKLYTVIASQIAKGSIAPNTTITILLPRGVDVLKPADLADSWLFLTAPLTAEAARKDWGLTVADKTAYLAVAGRYGVVKLADAEAEKTMIAYLSLPADKWLDWAPEALKTKDSFLHRSAVLVARNALSKDGSSVAAADLLQSAIQSKDLKTPTKIAAVNAMEIAKSDKAKDSLRAVAMDAAAPRSVRQRATEALFSVPGGHAVLGELKLSDDKLLATMSDAVLSKSPVSHDLVTLPANEANRLLAQLNATDVKDRRVGINAALDSLNHHIPTPAVLEALGRVAADSTNGLTAQLLVVDRLRGVNSKEAANALAFIVKDKTAPLTVRRQALFSISRIDSGISIGVLKALAESIDPSEKTLKSTAAGLAGS
jgi:hypothetical protein